MYAHLLLHTMWHRASPNLGTCIRCYTQCSTRLDRVSPETRCFINLYTVKKNVRPHLPMYSGWGIPHGGWGLGMSHITQVTYAQSADRWQTIVTMSHHTSPVKAPTVISIYSIHTVICRWYRTKGFLFIVLGVKNGKRGRFIHTSKDYLCLSTP